MNRWGAISILICLGACSAAPVTPLESTALQVPTLAELGQVRAWQFHNDGPELVVLRAKIGPLATVPAGATASISNVAGVYVVEFLAP
jgi:hypothetical protein